LPTDSTRTFGRPLAALPWLHDEQIVYWGDIDTHSFAILSRLRERLPARRRGTRVLRRSRRGPLRRDRIRLEQERIRCSLVRQALRLWLDGRN
jgi:hypothetical protein